MSTSGSLEVLDGESSVDAKVALSGETNEMSDYGSESAANELSLSPPNVEVLGSDSAFDTSGMESQGSHSPPRELDSNDQIPATGNDRTETLVESVNFGTSLENHSRAGTISAFEQNVQDVELTGQRDLLTVQEAPGHDSSDNKSEQSVKTETSFEIVTHETDDRLDSDRLSSARSDPSISVTQDRQGTISSDDRAQDVFLNQDGLDTDLQLSEERRNSAGKRLSALTMFSDGTASSRSTMIENSAAFLESSSQFDVRDALISQYSSVSQENMGNVAHSGVIPESNPSREENIDEVDENIGAESTDNDGNKNLNNGSENIESNDKIDENEADKNDQLPEESDANTMSFIEVEKPEMEGDDENNVVLPTLDATEVSKESEVGDIKLDQQRVDEFLQQLSSSQSKDDETSTGQQSSATVDVSTADVKADQEAVKTEENTEQSPSSTKLENDEETPRRFGARGGIDRSSVNFADSRRKFNSFLQQQSTIEGRSKSFQVNRPGPVRRHAGRSSVVGSPFGQQVKRASSLTSLHRVPKEGDSSSSATQKDPEFDRKMRRQRLRSGGEEMLDDEGTKAGDGGWGESIDEILDRRRRERASTVGKMDVHSRYNPTSTVDPHRFSISPATVGKLDMDFHIRSMMGKHHAGFEKKMRELYGDKYGDNFNVSYDDVLKYWRSRLRKIEERQRQRNYGSGGFPGAQLRRSDQNTYDGSGETQSSNFDHTMSSQLSGSVDDPALASPTGEHFGDVEKMLDAFFSQEGLDDLESLTSDFLDNLEADQAKQAEEREKNSDESKSHLAVSPMGDKALSRSVPGLYSDLYQSTDASGQNHKDQVLTSDEQHSVQLNTSQNTASKDEATGVLATGGGSGPVGSAVVPASSTGGLNSVSLSNEKEPPLLTASGNPQQPSPIPIITAGGEESYRLVERTPSRPGSSLRGSSTTPFNNPLGNISTSTSTTTIIGINNISETTIMNSTHSTDLMTSGSKQSTSTSPNESSIKLSPAERVAESTVRAASIQAGLKHLETMSTGLNQTIDQNGGVNLDRANSAPEYNRQQSNKSGAGTDVGRRSTREDTNPPAVIEPEQCNTIYSGGVSNPSPYTDKTPLHRDTDLDSSSETSKPKGPCCSCNIL